MTVTYREYEEAKKNFIEKHKGLFITSTSEMDEYGSYSKQYVANDRCVFYEVNSVEYVKAEVKKTTVTIKMFRTEFYSSDNSRSSFCYQQY